MADAVETMAYAGALPWHGLGFKVTNDLTPLEMMEASGTNWTVRKEPAFIMLDGKQVDVGRSALLRESDNKILDVISHDWNPTQNLVAFEFFRDYAEAGQLEMETAGSLNGGKNVWALAKLNKSFEAVRGDKIQGYLLFSNPHRYGQSITVRFTPIRVVCANTLAFALAGAAEGSSVSVNHRNVFNPAEVKKTLQIAEMKLDNYAEAAHKLANVKITGESLREYLKLVFPKNQQYAKATGKEVANDNELSKPAQTAMDNYLTQPGAEFAPGTFWQAFNAVTYVTDHKLGRSDNGRLSSAWFGINKDRKLRALNLAVQMAEAA